MKVKTVQVDNRLIIADGEGPLRYLDLNTNKVHVYKPPKVSLKRRILKLFRRQLFEDVLFFKKAEPIRLKPGKIWEGVFDPSDGFKTIGTRPNLMNILQTTPVNICVWYDGTLRPMKGHPKRNQTECKWKFDGSIWYHL